MPAPALVPPWQDSSEEEAKAAARTSGVLVRGAPGTGKSYWARELVAQLCSGGKVVNCVAKTHLACRNFQMGCETADHWVIKKVQNGDCAAVQYLVVEEASQINVQLWADICVAKQRGATLLCLATDVRPKLYVYLGSLLNQQVLHCSAVAVLHLLDHPVVRRLCSHLKVLARQVGLGNAVHHLAFGPELRDQLARPERFPDAGAAADEESRGPRRCLGLFFAKVAPWGHERGGWHVELRLPVVTL